LSHKNDKETAIIRFLLLRNLSQCLLVANLLVSQVAVIHVGCCVGDYLDYVKKIHVKFPNIGGLDQPNNKQKEAVRTAMYRQFTLIQGPPGTGKTVTVVRLIALYAFVNKTLDSRYHKNNIKPQVMICGPSNKSVDVIAGKTAVLSLITVDQANKVLLSRTSHLEQASDLYAQQ